MSVFLTPTLQPFVAGTYFPPKDMYGRPGFKTLLRRITEAWQSKKGDIKAQSEDSMEQLVSLSVLEGAVPLKAAAGGQSHALMHHLTAVNSSQDVTFLAQPC